MAPLPRDMSLLVPVPTPCGGALALSGNPVRVLYFNNQTVGVVRMPTCCVARERGRAVSPPLACAFPDPSSPCIQVCVCVPSSSQALSANEVVDRALCKPTPHPGEALDLTRAVCAFVDRMSLLVALSDGRLWTLALQTGAGVVTGLAFREAGVGPRGLLLRRARPRS